MVILKKYCIFLSLIFFLMIAASETLAQNYPPFTITAYDSTSSGFYFLCPVKVGANPAGIKQSHMVLDRRGQVVYYKIFDSANNTGDLKIQPNGLMSFNVNNKFYFMDSSFFVMDSVATMNGLTFDAHDIQVIPNGHILLLGKESIQMDLSAYHLFGAGHTNPGSANATVTFGVIQELDINHNVVFEWHSKDYFSFSDVDVSFLTNPNTVDLTHFNSVEVDDDGNFLVSSRHFDEITKINHSDSSIMWRLGGNANQFNFLNDPTKFKRQHDIRKLSNGNYSLFDNGDGNVSSPYHTARGKEYHLDENLLTANLVWSYENNPASHSFAMGSCGRDPNGTSIVCYGMNSNDDVLFTAVDNAGNKVLEIAFDDTLWSYRAFHYDTLPWNLNRPVISCFVNNGQFFLDAGPGRASYKWSNGATTQTIPMSAIGTYFVFVPKGDGGFISSEQFVVNDILNPCGITALVEPLTDGFTIFPNPVQGQLSLHFGKAKTSTEFVLITDLSGQITGIYPGNGKQEFSIETSNFAPGIYLIQCSGTVQKFIKL